MHISSITSLSRKLGHWLRPPHPQSWARMFALFLTQLTHVCVSLYESELVPEFPHYAAWKIGVASLAFPFAIPLWKRPFSFVHNLAVAFFILLPNFFGLWFRPGYTIGYFQAGFVAAFLLSIHERAFQYLCLLFCGTFVACFVFFWSDLPDSKFILNQTDQLSNIVIFVIVLLLIHGFYAETRRREDRSERKFALIGRQIASTLHDLKGVISTPELILYELEKENNQFSPLLKDALHGLSVDLDRVKNTLQTLNRIHAPAQSSSNLMTHSARLGEVLKEIEFLLGKKLLGFELVCRGDLEIPLTHSELISIVLNLVNNSVSAYSRNPLTGLVKRIEISAEQTNPGYTRILFQDHAGGFSLLALEALKSAEMISEFKQGSGLGMMIIREIVEQRAGTLSLSNQQGGARIVLEFPRVLT